MPISAHGAGGIELDGRPAVHMLRHTASGVWPGTGIRQRSMSRVAQARGIFEAGDRVRTDDIQLGKLTFYH